MLACMLISAAAGAYLSRAAVVLRKRSNLAKNSQPTANIHCCTRHARPKSSRYGPSVVAKGKSYCLGPVVDEIGAYGGPTAVDVFGALAGFANS